MTKKTRLIILLACAVLFFVITPVIILYSLGYRFDFEKGKIVATGGIYIKALPLGAEITIDSKTSNKTGLLSNYVFVQNLLPKQHSVLIKKDGYHDYQKNLDVKKNEVTKLENVVLFKKNIAFEIITDPPSPKASEGQGKTQSPFDQQITQDKYIIKNNNLYYSDIKDNDDLSPIQKNTPVIKNIIVYKTNGNMTWLALDGFLYSSDINGKNIEKLSQVSLKINKKNLYELIVFDQNTFLKENSNLFLFDSSTKSFGNFYAPIKDLKVSPDRQKILFLNDHEILFSFLNSNNIDKIFLNRFSEKINDAYWLGDDYIILSVGDKIIISEIDVRNNINTIELPQTLTLADEKVFQLNPVQAKIFFDQQDKKLYILTQNIVLVSERMVP